MAKHWAKTETIMVLSIVNNFEYCEKANLLKTAWVGDSARIIIPWVMVMSGHNTTVVMALLGQYRHTARVNSDGLIMDPKLILRQMDELGPSWFEAAQTKLGSGNWNEPLEMVQTKNSPTWAKALDTNNGCDRSFRAVKRYLTTLRMLALEAERRESDLTLTVVGDLV